jgi:hypothetical protein
MVARLPTGASAMRSSGPVDDEEWDRLAVDGGWDGGTDVLEHAAMDRIDGDWDPSDDVTAVTGCPELSDEEFTLVESAPPAPPPIQSEIRELGAHRTMALPVGGATSLAAFASLVLGPEAINIDPRSTELGSAKVLNRRAELQNASPTSSSQKQILDSGFRVKRERPVPMSRRLIAAQEARGEQRLSIAPSKTSVAPAPPPDPPWLELVAPEPTSLSPAPEPAEVPPPSRPPTISFEILPAPELLAAPEQPPLPPRPSVPRDSLEDISLEMALGRSSVTTYVLASLFLVAKLVRLVFSGLSHVLAREWGAALRQARSRRRSAV